MILVPRSEAARLLGMSETSIRRLEKRGLLKSIKLSPRMIRYSENELHRFAEEAVKNPGDNAA